MKKLVSIIVLLFILLLRAQAQNVKGTVSNASKRISGAVIKNLRTGNKTISDEMGMFIIRVKNSDTLLISKKFYKKDTLVYAGQIFLTIQLQPETKALREVTIKARQISPLDIYEKNKIEYKDIYWKGDYSHMFGIEAGLGAGVSINIDKLYNLLSKQGKDARKMQRTLTRDYHDDVVDRRFTVHLVGGITGYDGGKLDTFMMKYRPSYDFIVKATDYDVIQYIKDKFALDIKGTERNGR